MQEPYQPDSSGAGVSSRWWLVCIGLAVGVMVSAGLLIYVPKWPGTLIFILGLASFVAALRLNPRYWYRRTASALAGAAVFCFSIPTVHGWLSLADGTFGYFMIDNGNWGGALFVLAAITFGYFDFRSQHPAPVNQTPSFTSKTSVRTGKGDAAGQSLIKTGDHSPVTVQAGISEDKAVDTITTQAKAIGRLETELEAALADKPPAGEDPTIARLTDEQKKLVEEVLARGDAEMKAKAAILARDFETADRYLPEAVAPVLEKAYELATLKGDRHYYASEFDRAIEPYETALHLEPDSPVALNNLALALSQSQVADAVDNLERAIDLYRQLLEERTRERVPLEWALTQNNLGNALQALGERESGTGRLEEAVAVCRAALEVFKDAQATYYMEQTEQNLTAALGLLDSRGARAESDS